MKAVHKFPAICGEKDPSVTLSLDDVCKKELATMFAHMGQETGAHYPGTNGVEEEWRQGLYHVSEMGCSITGGGCDYGQCTGWVQEIYPCVAG